MTTQSPPHHTTQISSTPLDILTSHLHQYSQLIPADASAPPPVSHCHRTTTRRHAQSRLTWNRFLSMASSPRLPTSEQLSGLRISYWHVLYRLFSCRR